MSPDHIDVFTTGKTSITSGLESVYIYSTKWGLTINVKKINTICIFVKERNSTKYD